MEKHLIQSGECKTEDIIDPLPCPFCKWNKIRVYEAISEEGILKGAKYTYAYCRVCGTRGPNAYNISQDDDENYKVLGKHIGTNRMIFAAIKIQPCP